MTDENHGGCGYHLVTSATTAKLTSVGTDKVAGHFLKVTAYGNTSHEHQHHERKGKRIQLTLNGQVISTTSPQRGSFIFDALVFVDATENKIIVQIDSEANKPATVTVMNPLPETIVFGVGGASAVHNFQLWKLGLRF